MSVAGQRNPPRIALFTDSFHEANGVATLSRHLAGFAQSRGWPFLVVRGGPKTALVREGSLLTLELKRGVAAFPVDKDLYMDPLLVRHKRCVMNQLSEFKPDLVHITGPGDLGFLGVWAAHLSRIPLAASWHTNLHEYLARRLDLALSFAPKKLRDYAVQTIQRQSLRGLLRFYQMARFVMAPNQRMVNLLHARTGRPAFLMRHGVDVTQYGPKLSGDNQEGNSNQPFCIGYVGRLTVEKNVRVFAELEHRLIAGGQTNYRFLIVGEGGQGEWLKKNLRRAEMPGLLRGNNLAAAYSRMDAFVFPSRTDTFGLVILEAMASGVPVILSPEAGERVGVTDGVDGLLSDDISASLQKLMQDARLRKSMSDACRKLAKDNSWDLVFDELYETYAQGLMVQDNRREERESRRW